MKTMREIINATDGIPLLEGRVLYEADEHVWIEQQIEALKQNDAIKLDRETLIEYLTEMTIRDKRELKSRFAVLVQHLLKVTYQPSHFSHSWLSTIQEQQRQIDLTLSDTPSLKRLAPEYLESVYSRAAKDTSAETGLPKGTFPTTCPWSVEEALAFECPPLTNKE